MCLSLTSGGGVGKEHAPHTSCCFSGTWFAAGTFVDGSTAAPAVLIDDRPSVTRYGSQRFQEQYGGASDADRLLPSLGQDAQRYECPDDGDPSSPVIWGTDDYFL